MLSENPTGLKLFLHLLAIAFLLPGCAAAQGPDDTGGEETSGPREGDRAPQTTMMVAGSEPPGTTVSYGGETVEGGLGTYCWTAGGAGACADAVGILLEDGALEAPAGATLSFAYRGRELDSLGVAAYRAGREGEGGGREDDVFVPPYSGDGGRRTSASVAPGRGRVLWPTCPPASTCSTPSPRCPRATPPTASG